MASKCAAFVLPLVLNPACQVGVWAQSAFSAKVEPTEARYKPPGLDISDSDFATQYYQVAFEWTHDPSLSMVLNKDRIKNPMKDGGVCDPKTAEVAPEDGQPYWMPRFHPRAVPSEVTELTGIRLASIDWQPCGHKDIVICHGESHYDFHLYYADQAELNQQTCVIEGQHQLICREDNVVDDAQKFAVNHKFFDLMENNIPVSMISEGGSEAPVSYCVDPTSAIPSSGIHYGDRGETLKEWKSPVTILGSYDCKLTFFEPMLSWRWIGDQVSGNKGWPRWDSKFIKYNNKALTSLPIRWAVDVSESCRDVAGKDRGTYSGPDPAPCKIKVTIVGEKCPAGSDGCKEMIATRSCGARENCLKPSGLANGASLYKSPGATLSTTTTAPTTSTTTTETTTTTTTSLASTSSTTTSTTSTTTTTPTTTSTTAPSTTKLSTTSTITTTTSSSTPTASENVTDWKYGSDTHYFCNGHTIVYGLNDDQHDELCEDSTTSPSPPLQDAGKIYMDKPTTTFRKSSLPEEVPASCTRSYSGSSLAFTLVLIRCFSDALAWLRCR